MPSASIAIAKDGKLAYAEAFGLARTQPALPAKASMAYPIGSISKQFTATAILLLQQDGKLSIDDPIGKYFPNFTRANDVKLRNLLTMTSGYEDFAPQDYIIPAWLQPVKPLELATEWATKPLDFEPGTEWQYSNTNFVILGLVVEKVSGKTLPAFLKERVLKPLALEGVVNTYDDRDKLPVTGYVSYAMQPVRVSALEDAGWYFGDGDLAMPASTLVKWDLTIAQQKLLSPASYKEMTTAFTLKNGKSANYGLGVFSRDVNGHHMIEHSGEVGGFVAENVLFPDDGVAIVVLTNEVASSAAGAIAHQLFPLLMPTPATTTDSPVAAALKQLLPQLQQGSIDRAALTSNASSYFTADALTDFRATLAPLGALKDVTQQRTALRGGMTFGLYTAKFEKGSVRISTYYTKDGKIEQLLITGKE
ncbi:serine hydrolase domain-containing protein [Granulicella cerasi]|uniref:Serine hydrolase domain-containing protein n=1 Tax=Granulicella cerasi TaxID=741063 RepID=A0ABW1ZCL1_9BACT|nr:serine hydrolase domain-containing protein [Granulicella cerasi]